MKKDLKVLWICAAIWLISEVLAFGAATVLFMSDFGTVDDSVAICKGVMLEIDPDLRIIDITHQVTPFSVADASRFLAGTTLYYPAGAVFLVVVDPGVGSSRKPLVVKSKRNQYFVLPDNGIITPVIDRDGLEGAREISNTAWMLRSARSSTFHGRDIFSPVAARLARGEDWTQVGPETKELVIIPQKNTPVTEDGIHGEIIGLDGSYGNLVTNIPAEEFLKLHYDIGGKVQTRIGGREVIVPFVRTFSDVPLNSPLLYIDSRGRVGLAVNQGSFAEAFHIKPPVSIVIQRPSPEGSK